MREQGLGPVEAVLSDNAKCYTGHQFAHTLDELGARHIRIPPYTPRWNGKLERFFGTLEDEWAHGRTWPDSATRDRALSSFIRYFNRWRHTAPPAADHPSPASSRTAGRTASDVGAERRGQTTGSSL